MVLVTVKVTTPLAFELPLAAEIVDVELLSDNVTVLPATGLLFASFSVTVTVEVVVPSAVTLMDGAEVTVEVDALTAPATKATLAVSVMLTLSPVAE